MIREESWTCSRHKDGHLDFSKLNFVITIVVTGFTHKTEKLGASATWWSCPDNKVLDHSTQLVSGSTAATTG